MQRLDAHLNSITNAILALVFLSAMAGCGYHFEGMGLKAPEGIRTIAITVLENRTSESGIETVFTSDLAYEFTRSKVLQVVGKDTADAVLMGKIVSLRVGTISHSADYYSDERRVTITLDLALKRPNGDVIWSDRSLSDKEAFKVIPSDKLLTEKNRRAAIKTMSERLAERIHNRILQGF
jgi:outer membrane lipopolysaccharide assembly protein LptE/RlpB